MLVKKYIAYIGIKEPTTSAQVKVEISGLRHAIEVAKEQIANLEQALAIAELQKEELSYVQENKPCSQKESELSETDSETEEGSKGSESVS